MRDALPTFLLLLLSLACGTDPVVEENQDPQPPPAIAKPDTAPGPVRVVDTSARFLAPDTLAPPKPRTNAVNTTEGPCSEEVYAENNQGRITVFIPKRQLAARTSEIRELLPGVFLHAEHTSPRSIADDFERGISTERSSMPDKLPVEVLVFERCRSTEPHTVLHLRVWREADGSFGSDGW
jgi:hypothetical protein